MKGFYYSYIWSHMHGLCKGRNFFCTRLISRKLCGFLLTFSTSFTSLSVLFVFLFRSSFSSLSTVIDSISSNTDEVLSINSSTNVFVFGDFKDYHKDCLTYFGGTDRPGELCYNFSISNDLSQMVNFSIVLLFWVYFFPLRLLFVLQWLSLHWEIPIMFLCQFPLTFHYIHNEMTHFIAYL